MVAFNLCELLPSNKAVIDLAFSLWQEKMRELEKTTKGSPCKTFGCIC